MFGSAFASAAYLKYNLKFPDDKYVYVIGEQGLEHELDAVGIKHKGGTVGQIVALPTADQLMSISGRTGPRGQHLFAQHAVRYDKA